MPNKKKPAKKKSLTCVICEKSLGKTKVKLQCQNCQKWAHQECTGVQNNWTCAECKEDASSNEDDTDSENETDDSSGSEPDETIKNKKSPTSHKKFTLNDVMKKLEKIETKHDELLNKFQEVLEENAKLKDEIKNLKTKQKQLEKQTANSITESNKTKQEKLSKNIIIQGLEKANISDYKKLITKIGDGCNSKIEERDIEQVHNIGKDASKTVLKVQFYTIETKQNLLSAYKSKRGLTRQQIGQNGTETIYINHDMTNENQMLFKQARELKKELNFKFAWFNHNKVMIRKDDESKILEVDSEDSIIKIKKKFQKEN